MDKPYEVQFEIAGPAAMFARPDSGELQPATQCLHGRPQRAYLSPSLSLPTELRGFALRKWRFAAVREISVVV